MLCCAGSGDLINTQKKREVNEQTPSFFLIIINLDNNILIIITLAGFICWEIEGPWGSQRKCEEKAEQREQDSAHPSLLLLRSEGRWSGCPHPGVLPTPRGPVNPNGTAKPFSYAGGISLGSHILNRSLEGLNGTNLLLPRSQFTASEPLGFCCRC